jgi:hypothetical protein
MSNNALNRFTERVSGERNVSPDLVRAVITDFLREVHECIYKEESYVHALPNILFQVGEEALYHFGGILIQSTGQDCGDFGGMANESIARLAGYRLKRFRTLVDKWAMEKSWDDEEAGR